MRSPGPSRFGRALENPHTLLVTQTKTFLKSTTRTLERSVDVGVDNGSEAGGASGSYSTVISAVAGIMHQANLPVTPRPTHDVDAAVPPEGKEAAFASDQDGDDFEIYNLYAPPQVVVLSCRCRTGSIGCSPTLWDRGYAGCCKRTSENSSSKHLGE